LLFKIEYLNTHQLPWQLHPSLPVRADVDGLPLKPPNTAITLMRPVNCVLLILFVKLVWNGRAKVYKTGQFL